MLGNLKKKAMDKAMEELEKKIGPSVQEKIELFQNLKPSDVNDDDKYKAIIISPLWQFANLQSGGAIGVAQKFVDVESKFSNGLFNVRNELIQVDGEAVSLDPDFSNKIVSVLVQSIKS
ncbi:MAG: hypothetical protein GY874_05630 [Desulfobacteraceae bacterium]|nr:hypothetical protein [Desulfobacteraceae bacterium]